ncbi:MAG: HEAT repeat protein [Candidatus Paceibacteria bacterium]|jgi:HEAT repeat protein
MKTLSSLGILLITAILLLDPAAGAHGGAYRGPGDNTAPPPGGGSGGSSSGGSSGGSGGSTAPSNSGPGSAGSGGSGRTNSGPVSGLPMGGGNDDSWEPWWAFNRDPFLNLKAVIHQGNVVIGSDTFFLGYSDPSLARDHLGPNESAVRTQIVPALRRVLKTESDGDLVTGVLVALAKIGEDPAAQGDEQSLAETIQPFLASPNQEIAETAAVSLGILGDFGSVVLLSHLLRDTEQGQKKVGGGEVHWRTRAFAAYGLGLIGFRMDKASQRRFVLEVLTTELEGDALDLSTPDVAVACLTAIGLVPLEVDLKCQMQSQRTPGPLECRHGQVAWLRELFDKKDLNYVVRAHIPTILARLVQGLEPNDPLRHAVAGDLLALIAGGSKTRSELRASALIALGLFASASDDEVDKQVIAALMGTAKNSRQPRVRTLAFVSLGQAAGRVSTGMVDEEGVAKVRSFLLKELEQGRSTDRGWVALALSLQERAAQAGGAAPSAQVPKLLAKVMRDAKSPNEIGAYAVALGIVQDLESAKLLHEKLSVTADDRARGYICLGLGLMNSRSSVGMLRGLLESAGNRPLLLRESAISLGLVGDKSVVLDLVTQLNKATSLTSQSSIAAALGAIGDARSVDPLLHMLEDPKTNVRARAFAAVALGIVADKEALPWNAKIAVGANYMAGTPTLTDGQGAGILDIL